MPGCAVLKCTNSAKKGFLMKKFPKDPVRRHEWVINIKRDNWNPTDSSCLCEAHFAPEMWEKTRIDGSRKLRAYALPTIFLFSPSTPKRKQPATRIVKAGNPELALLGTEGLENKIVRDEDYRNLAIRNKLKTTTVPHSNSPKMPIIENKYQVLKELHPITSHTSKEVLHESYSCINVEEPGCETLWPSRVDSSSVELEQTPEWGITFIQNSEQLMSDYTNPSNLMDHQPNLLKVSEDVAPKVSLLQILEEHCYCMKMNIFEEVQVKEEVPVHE